MSGFVSQKWVGNGCKIKESNCGLSMGQSRYFHIENAVVSQMISAFLEKFLWRVRVENK